MMTRALILVGAVGALTTAGWMGGGPGYARSALAAQEIGPRIEACDLLTKGEIEAALGKPVAEPFRTEQDGYGGSGTSLVTVCNWDAGGLLDGVAVTVRQAPSGGKPQTSEEYARSAKEDYERQKADPEAAVYLPDIRFSAVDMAPHASVLMDWGDYVVVQVHQNGEGWVQVSVSAPSAETAEALARIAMTRLP
jgi:hypothetical protein